MVSFHIKGANKLSCRMAIINTGNQTLPSFTVAAKQDKQKIIIDGTLTKEGYMEYILNGNQQIQVSWKQK